MSNTWPKQRGKTGNDLFDAMREAQTITLTCGVDGCRKKWTGAFGSVKAKRDAHRADAHPHFKPPKRMVRGFADKKRAVAA